MAYKQQIWWAIEDSNLATSLSMMHHCKEIGFPITLKPTIGGLRWNWTNACDPPLRVPPCFPANTRSPLKSASNGSGLQCINLNSSSFIQVATVLVDRERIELSPSPCKGDVLPLSLTARNWRGLSFTENPQLLDCYLVYSTLSSQAPTQPRQSLFYLIFSRKCTQTNKPCTMPRCFAIFYNGSIYSTL